MYDDLYCKVFVDTDMDYEKLFAFAEMFQAMTLRENKSITMQR